MARTRTGLLALIAVLVLTALRTPAEETSAPVAPAHPAPPPMSEQELQSFLARPLVAHLALVRGNGSPQLVPMWFLFKDGAFYMSTRTYAAKLKHLRKNPRVAIVIDVMEAPLKNKSVTVSGTAQVLTSGVQEMTAAIYRKYVGEQGMASAAAQHNINEPRVILKIIPKKIVTMDTTR